METPEQYTVKTPEEKLFTPWTMRKCDCGHEACDSYFVSFTNDGRMTKEQAELVIQAPQLKEEITRLKGTIGAEAVRQNLELKEENAELRKALQAIVSLNGIGYGPDAHLFVTDLQPLINNAESALSKHQPIKKDEN